MTTTSTTRPRPSPIDVYDDDLLGGSSDMLRSSSNATAAAGGGARTTTMSASSPSQGAHTPTVTNTTCYRQDGEPEQRRGRKKKKKKHSGRQSSRRRDDLNHAEHYNDHGDDQQDDHDDEDDDDDDRLVTIRIHTPDNRDDGTTVWTCPYSLLERRELEMQQAAQSFGIPSTRWSASLIFNLVCQELATRHDGGNLDITICPSMNALLRQYQPNNDGHEHDNDHDAAVWPLWLTNLILGYYETGQLIVPNACQGQDLLLALEYFAILYAPDQLVFESYNAYQRVRIWSEYLTQRALLAEWIDESISATTTTRRKRQQQQQQQQYVFYFGTATNPQERLRAGPKSMPLSIFHGSNADESNNTNNNMCRVVYRLFNPSHENQVSEELCRDFCRYLQQVLSTTNNITGERTNVQAQFAVKMIHVETIDTNINNKTKKKRLKFEESSADESSCSDVRESNSSFREERAVLKVVVLVVGPDDDDNDINNNIILDNYQQLNSVATDSIQCPYMNNDRNLLQLQEKMLLEAAAARCYVDSSSAFTPQPQSLEDTTTVHPQQQGRRSSSPCISISSKNRSFSPTSVGSSSNRSILKYKQPVVRSATMGTETSRTTPCSHPMDEKSIFSGQTGWSEGMGPPPLSITSKKQQTTTTAKSTTTSDISPKDVTSDIYNTATLNESIDQQHHQQTQQPRRRRKSSWRKGDEPLQQAPHPPPATPTTTDGIASNPSPPTTLDPVFGSHEETPPAAGVAGTGVGATTGAAAATSAAVAAKTKTPNNTRTARPSSLQRAPVSVIGFDNQTVTSALTGPFFTVTGISSLPQLEQAQSLSKERQGQDAPPDISMMTTVSKNKKIGSSFESSSAGKESEEVRAQALHHEWVQGSYMNRDISTRVRELLKAEEERTKQAAAAAAVAAVAAAAAADTATEEGETTTAAADETQLVVDAGTTKSSSSSGGDGGTNTSADQQPQKTNRTKQRANQIEYNRQLKYKGRRLGYSDNDDDMPPKALEVSSAESSATSDDPSTVATVDGSITEIGCESHWDRLLNYVCDLGSECLQPIDRKDCGGALSKQESKLSQRGRTGRPLKRNDKQDSCLSELPDFEKTGMPTRFPSGCGYFNSQPGHSSRNDDSDDDDSSSGSDSSRSTSIEVQQAPAPKATQRRAASGTQRHDRPVPEIQPEQKPKPSKKKGRNEKHNEMEQQLQQKLQLQQQQQHHHQQQPQQQHHQQQQQQQQEQQQPHRKSNIIEIPVKHYMRQIVQQQLDQPTTHVARVDEKHTRRLSPPPARKSIATPTRQTSPLARGLALRNSSPAKIQAATAGQHQQQQQQAADRRTTPSRGRGNVNISGGGGGQPNGSSGGLFRKMGSAKKVTENGNKEAISSAAPKQGFRFWKKKNT